MPTILHIEAGTEDWDPTPEDLEGLTKLFLEASKEPDIAVVATREGVKVSVLTVPTVDSVNVSEIKLYHNTKG